VSWIKIFEKGVRGRTILGAFLNVCHRPTVEYAIADSEPAARCSNNSLGSTLCSFVCRLAPNLL
jgi:hypothetical protein